MASAGAVAGHCFITMIHVPLARHWASDDPINDEMCRETWRPPCPVLNASVLSPTKMHWSYCALLIVMPDTGVEPVVVERTTICVPPSQSTQLGRVIWLNWPPGTILLRNMVPRGEGVLGTQTSNPVSLPRAVTRSHGL